MRTQITTIGTKIYKNKLFIYFLLLVVGMMSALIFVKPHMYLTEEQRENITRVYMNVRLDFVQDALDGKPIEDHENAYFYYLAVFKNIFDIDNIPNVYLYFQYGVVMFMFSIFPVLVKLAFGNTPFAFFSVILLNILVAPIFYYKSDQTYILYIALVLGAITIFAILKRKHWDKVSYFLLCFGLLLASSFNTIRGGGGLPVLIGLIYVVVLRLVIPSLRTKKIKPIIISLFMFVVATPFVSQIIPLIFLSQMGYVPYNVSNYMWHAAYVGLGWEENPFGIYYIDMCGYERGFELYNNTPNHNVDESSIPFMNSELYFKTIRKEYFHMLFTHFDFFFFSYVRKAIEIVKQTITYAIYNVVVSKLAFLMSIFALSQIFGKKTFLKGFSLKFGNYIHHYVIVIVMSVFAAITPMLAVPEYYYEYGVFGGASMLMFLTLAILFTCWRKKEI